VSLTLFQSLSQVHRYDDLEDLLDFACETLTETTDWSTALVTYYFGEDVAYGAAGCPPGTKERFRESFARTTPADRKRKRGELTAFLRPGTNICFIPAGEGPRPAKAFIPSRVTPGTWDPLDRLLILMRDPQDRILGLLSLDNPKSGDRPDDAEFERLKSVDAFVNVVGKIAENRFWAQRLQESEDAYRAIFDAATDGFFINDLEGRIVQVNPAGCRVHGYERDELIGTPVGRLVPETHRELFERAFRDVPTGEPIGAEATSLRKDGSTFDCEVYATGFQYRGRPHLLVVLRDITERKRLLMRLLEEQKDESIVAVAGGVAHDFNNLLMGITGPLSLLRERLEPGSEDARQADRVAATADSLTRLTGQLLAVARGVHSEPRPASLQRIVEENLPLLHGLVGSRYRLDLRIETSDVHVHADRAQLDQVLLNLAQNACESMERGGTLGIAVDVVEKPEPFLCMRTGTHPAGTYVRLLVEDSGQGMDEPTLQRVFDPYFSTKANGSGLGLAAVLGIVRRHSGAISIQSAEGRGTKVEVLLPPCEAPAPPVAESEPPRAPGPGPRSVLLVDDNDAVREMAAELLSVLGCHVVSASSGEEALRVYADGSAPFDLVLLDVSMPGMTGIEAHEELTKMDPSVRVVLTSGHAERLVREEMEQGLKIAGFLQKPYTLDRLREALDLAMRA